MVPKEQCTCISFHPYESIAIASFTDGYLRFFDIGEKATSIGRAKIAEKDYINELVILPSGSHLLCSTILGEVLIVFIERWDPLAIRIDQIASINTHIHSFSVSQIEPYNKFLCGSQNGKVIVYNKKNFNAFSQEPFTDQTPVYNFMDCFNVLDFVENGFEEIDSKGLTLDHYYEVSKKNYVKNEALDENYVEAAFSPVDVSMHISVMRSCNKVFFRNYDIH